MIKERAITKDPVRRGRLLSTISTIGLMVLMIVYLLMTTIGPARLADQAEIISEHPFEAVIAAGDAELYVLKMNLRTGRLQRHYGAEDIEYVSYELDKLHALLEKPLEKLEGLYLGDPVHVRKLRETLALLEDRGARVRCVDNGREAPDAFLASQPGQFDVILMDVQMPVMNGHEAARQIRASAHPQAMAIPIFAVTANAFSNDISAALAAGMNAHISKPLQAGQLCSVLAEHIGRTERQDEA